VDDGMNAGDGMIRNGELALVRTPDADSPLRGEDSREASARRSYDECERRVDGRRPDGDCLVGVRPTANRHLS
jgi:hypothetical protein